MNWTLHSFQHIGRRDEQQDRVLVLRSGPTALCLVADGVGGQRGGAQAAQAVVDTARRLWEQGIPAAEEASGFLRNLVSESHRDIQTIDAGHGADPRSTVAGALLHGRQVAWVSCGDSRLYRFKKRSFLWRSKDHTVVELLKERGKIMEDEMGTHPDQGKLFQTLGGTASPEADFGEFELGPGQWLLLCSDGFWEHLRQDEIASLYSLFACSRARRERQLLRTILRRAGDGCDNISLLGIMPPALPVPFPFFNAQPH